MRFVAGLLLVAVGAALFAVGFRLSLIPLYRRIAGEDDVVAAVTALPAWLRLTVPAFGGLIAGLISRYRISRVRA